MADGTQAPNVPAFRSKWKEFEPLDDATIQMALDDAIEMLDAELWGSAYRRAVMLLAAHYLALRAPSFGRRGVTGNVGSIDTFVRSIGIGDRRVMYGERRLATDAGYKYGPGESMYGSTVYGAQFLELRSSRFPAVALV